MASVSIRSCGGEAGGRLGFRFGLRFGFRAWFRVVGGVFLAGAVCGTGCVSTGSVQASLGKRGIEVHRIETAQTASATGQRYESGGSMRLALVGDGGGAMSAER